MIIQQHSTIGTFHSNHNEDFLTIDEIGNDTLLIALMDGCSMGKESHFAAALIAKLLRKIAKSLSFRAFVEKEEKDLKQYLKIVLEQLFHDLKITKNSLMLEREELLSTLILGLIHSKNRTAEILTIGDGLIGIDGEYIEYEQDNQPDYLGYHLSQDFATWFASQEQFLSLKNITDLSIATDGIFTFKRFDHQRYPIVDDNYLRDFLLLDQEGKASENMLLKKLITIEQQFGLKPSDDLSIIRLFF